MSTDIIDYIFEFDSEADAIGDAVIGPYFVPSSGLSRDVLLFARELSSTVPLQSYWCMITKAAPIDQTLFNHAHNELVNNRSRQVSGLSSLLKYNLLNDAAQLQIAVSAMGVHTVNGFIAPFPAPSPVPPTPPDGLIAEDGIIFLVAEDGSTFLVQE